MPQSAEEDVKLTKELQRKRVQHKLDCEMVVLKKHCDSQSRVPQLTHKIFAFLLIVVLPFLTSARHPHYINQETTLSYHS